MLLTIKENYLKMKLRYRIKIALMKWSDRRREKLDKEENRRYLIDRILLAKKKGHIIVMRDRVYDIEDLKWAFEKIGIKYCIATDDKGQKIIEVESY